MGFRQSSKRIESIKIVNIIIITFHEDVKRRSRQKRGPDLSSVLLKSGTTLALSLAGKNLSYRFLLMPDKFDSPALSFFPLIVK